MYNQRGTSAKGPIPESSSGDLTGKAVKKLYKNPLDCLIQTVRTEGLLAVYKVVIFQFLIDCRDSLHIYYVLHRILFCIFPRRSH